MVKQSLAAAIVKTTGSFLTFMLAGLLWTWIDYANGFGYVDAIKMSDAWRSGLLMLAIFIISIIWFGHDAGKEE